MKSTLAISGGPKTNDRNFDWPVFDESEVNAVADVVRSGKVLSCQPFDVGHD